ncbi:membrane protein FxsA [Pueribacillus theae]|uniref:Membrane protein FxsA n=1 Tax=Pueribacillus theae TaxID=2171751 RepID=A0A2U1K0T9_9BACI|nr:FxsA family protein [Pueribacillus theae]PWA11116.1 membrane protein FxsA [Pueribacillus theae]
MFRIVLALIILVPAIEITVLIWTGSKIGVGWTLFIILATGILGAWLAKRQGLQVLHLAQVQIQNRDMPTEAILDGICVLAGGVFLLTPGFVTDIAGLFLLIPYTRAIVKLWLKKWIGHLIRRGNIGFFIKRPF